MSTFANEEERLKARLEYIISSREAGMTYEAIGKSLPKKGFGDAVSKVRIKTIIEQQRPDLMGSVVHRKEWRKR